MYFHCVWEKHYLPEVHTIPFVGGIIEGEVVWYEPDYDTIEECYRLSHCTCNEIAYYEE